MMENKKSVEDLVSKRFKKKSNDDVGGSRRNHNNRGNNHSRGNQRRSSYNKQQGYNSNKSSRKTSNSSHSSASDPSDVSQTSDNDQVPSNITSVPTAKCRPPGLTSLFEIINRKEIKFTGECRSGNRVLCLLKALNDIENGVDSKKNDSKRLPYCCFDDVHHDSILPQDIERDYQLALELKQLICNDDAPLDSKKR